MNEFKPDELRLMSKFDTSSKQNLLADLEFLYRHTLSIDILVLTITARSKLKKTSDKEFAKLRFPKTKPLIWRACNG